MSWPLHKKLERREAARLDFLTFEFPAHRDSSAPLLCVSSVLSAGSLLAHFHPDHTASVHVLSTIIVLEAVYKHAVFSHTHTHLHTSTDIHGVSYVAQGKALLPNEPPALCFSRGAERELTLMQT